MNRRQAVGNALRAATVLCLPWLGVTGCGSRSSGSAVVPAVPFLKPAASLSVARAYVFLYRMMDKYATGSKLRLLQSFVPTRALNLGDLGFTYDNAVAIVALLARGTAADVTRAKVLGNSLAYAQSNDPIPDGRIRTAYYVHPFVKANGVPNYEPGGAFDVGNTAWTGLALMRLHAQTGATSYLNAALRLGSWIYANAHDTRGAGGYTGGLTSGGQRIPWKSTEHNIDTYAFFTMLGGASGDSRWAARAKSALSFVDSMWNAAKQFYWIGSLNDGVSPNTVPIPEDVQSWSYLATGRSAFAASIDWARRNLAPAAGSFGGVSFSNADRSGAWFEGTGHMAAALLARNAPGDAAQAAAYLNDLGLAQAQAPHADGYGIDAASKDGLRTGDGDKYFAALHVGATAWTAIAALKANPFVLP